MFAVDVVDGGERIAAPARVHPEPEQGWRRRHRAVSQRARNLARPHEQQGSEEREVHPSVVADEARRAEEEGGEQSAFAEHQEKRPEQQGEEERLARPSRARLDMQGREREPEGGPEARLRAPLALGNAVEQPDAHKAAGEREETRRDDAVAQQTHEPADESEVQRSILVRFQVSVPQVRGLRPPLRQLDSHRRVAVMLVAKEHRQGARGERDHERDGQRPLQDSR